jgi:hypothetical protein
MDFSRRGFLRSLLAAPALGASALALDWERLLWTPKAMVSVPALSYASILEVEKTKMLWKLSAEYFQASPFLYHLRNK